MTTSACNTVENGSMVLTLKPDVKFCFARDGSEVREREAQDGLAC